MEAEKRVEHGKLISHFNASHLRRKSAKKREYFEESGLSPSHKDDTLRSEQGTLGLKLDFRLDSVLDVRLEFKLES